MGGARNSPTRKQGAIADSALKGGARSIAFSAVDQRGPLPCQRRCCMAAADPKLERLLKAERLAFERYDRLRGYPGDVQEVALALWTEATEAVREYRSKHP